MKKQDNLITNFTSSHKEKFLQFLKEKTQKAIQLSEKVRGLKEIIYDFQAKKEGIFNEMEKKRNEILKQQQRIEKMQNKERKKTVVNTIFEIIHGFQISNFNSKNEDTYYFTIDLQNSPSKFSFLLNMENETNFLIKFEQIASFGCFSNFFEKNLILTLKSFAEVGNYEDLEDFMRDMSFCIKSVSVFVSLIKKIGEQYCVFFKVCKPEGRKIKIEGNMLNKNFEKLKITFDLMDWIHKKIEFESKEIQSLVTWAELGDVLDRMNSVWTCETCNFL